MGSAGYLHSVETAGTVDGPGIRYVAFLQGCPLRCLYCHNPDSWKARSGKLISAEELVRDVERYRKFMRNGGLTLSGGEPLYQLEFVAEVLELCRRRDIHTAIDTSGIIPLEQCRNVVALADLIILDIKAIDSPLAKTITGKGNENALELLQWCEAVAKPVWIRHVVVPGYTDQDDNFERLARHLAPLACVRKVELLPFHQMASYKWEALGRTYKLKDCPVPDRELMDRANAIVRAHGLPM